MATAPNQQQPAAPPASTRKSVAGFVTKLVGDGATYGFINDEIFFQQASVTEGGPAAVGDRVFAECEYSAHLPIKWNATSVKVLNKAPPMAGQQQSQTPAILESDPRKQARQAMLSQQPPTSVPSQTTLAQQQSPFSQPPASVASTYQQHRQQRMHRQVVDQHDTSIEQPQHPDPNVVRLLDPVAANPSEFYPINNSMTTFPQQQPQQPQQQQTDLATFQADTPMGPPKLTYTSQLGSAFVQNNQFMPAPFLPQQPILPQQQTQAQQPQLLGPINQMTNQNNQRQNNRGRFNNQEDKKDNRRNNQNRARSDGKFDHTRDRDGSQDNRNSRQGNSRDRGSNNRAGGTGGNQRRDDSNSRPSPSAHTSARSTTNATSERGHKSTKRHYESQNIPRGRILIDMNGWNMKQRCSSSVHVPSDLKNVIVNQYLRLDIKNTPKPLKFKIEQQKTEISEKEEQKPATVTGASNNDETVEKEAAVSDIVQQVEQKPVVELPKKDDQGTPPSSKSDIKLNHKYGVKIVLISLPELETIYKTVFGPELNSFANESRIHPRLDETIEILCNKGPNGGHSLIGGKFDPVLDGFLEGEVNEFERHGRQPDLLATCKRVVLEQTGLDLGSCRTWTLISTFMYNHKTDYFSSKANIEYSFIYLPHIWTMNDSFDESMLEQESMKVNVSNLNQDLLSESECTNMDVQESGVSVIQSITSDVKEVPTDDSVNEPVTVELAVEPVVEPVAEVVTEAEVTLLNPDNLSDLKVADLKAELDKRGVKYEPKLKKADLVILLRGNLVSNIEIKTSENDATQPEEIVDDTQKLQDQAVTKEDELEEGEVADTADNTPEPEDESLAAPADDKVAKRKDYEEDQAEDVANKKICTHESPPQNSQTKKEKIELIKEPFVVRAREGQQQLTTVSLYETNQTSRYDQFELSVTSNILRESLIQHLSEYILTALVEDSRQKVNQGDSNSATSNGSSLINSQDTNSDSNNNSAKETSKIANNLVADKVNLKELPVDRYINLAFTYFDSAHMGYVHSDDLNKLFNNTGLTISKRALTSLIGDGEKFHYRTLPDLSPKLPPTYIYKFPEQFSRLPGHDAQNTSSSCGRTIEFQGVQYDVEQLIKQVKEAETLRVNLADRYNYAIENFDKQAEEIHVLEVNQKSLSKAIKSQNDEICDLKRERDSIKKKYDNVRRGIKSTIASLGDLVKDEK